jgi:hypothetical protein
VKTVWSPTARFISTARPGKALPGRPRPYTPAAWPSRERFAKRSSPSTRTRTRRAGQSSRWACRANSAVLKAPDRWAYRLHPLKASNSLAD